MSKTMEVFIIIDPGIPLQGMCPETTIEHKKSKDVQLFVVKLKN